LYETTTETQAVLLLAHFNLFPTRSNKNSIFELPT